MEQTPDRANIIQLTKEAKIYLLRSLTCGYIDVEELEKVIDLEIKGVEIKMRKVLCPYPERFDENKVYPEIPL